MEIALIHKLFLIIMMLLVTYDVETKTPAGKRRLHKVAKECCNHGQRVQNSVFECNLDNATFIAFRAKLLKLIDVTCDSLRIYNLGNNYQTKIEHYGVKETYDPEGDLIL